MSKKKFTWITKIDEIDDIDREAKRAEFINTRVREVHRGLEERYRDTGIGHMAAWRRASAEADSLGLGSKKRQAEVAKKRKKKK